MAKFRVMMKNPDCVYEAISEAAEQETSQITDLEGEERELVYDSRREKIDEACKKWFKYGEYLEVEVDTDADTCVVIPAN